MKMNFTRRLKFLALLLFCLGGYGAVMAQITITGKATDAKTGEALINASIAVKGTPTGTVTDVDGTYTISAPENGTLVVAFLGYNTLEVAVNGRKTIDIALSASEESLKEVVVVGYGSQRKSDLTGAISTIKSDELAKTATGSVEQALEGKIAGVQVTPVSGEPGAGAVVHIRGVGTLNNASPLYVVDGMLLDDISYLNANDIDNLEVLKDASATAIYGSRGANGVMIVTTKKGKSGNTVISLNTYYGSQSLGKKIALVNGNQYAHLANQVAANEGIAPLFANPDSYGVGTDWQNAIFQTAPMKNVNLSARGGNDRMTFSVSGDYFDQTGIVKGSDYQRYSLRINNEYKLTDFIKLGHNIAFVYDQANVGANPISDALHADPTVSVQDSAGHYGNTGAISSVGNPVAEIFYHHDKKHAYRGEGNVYVDISFLKYLTFRSQVGLDYSNLSEKVFTPVFNVSPTQQNIVNNLTINTGDNLNRQWDNTLTFDKSWSNIHHLNVLAGITAQTYRTETFQGYRTNLPGESEDFWYLSSGQVVGQTNANNAGEWRIFSTLFRVNYTLMDRYLLTASYRRDGSTRFGKDKQYGDFPSIALGWRIKKEAFLKNVTWLDNLKLRVSYGAIGNDKTTKSGGGPDYYPGRPLIANNLIAVFGPGETLNNGATQTDLANPLIQWEESISKDIGFDAGFFNNRLTAEVDYYNRQTNKILINVPIPAYVGAENNPVVNAASVVNRGLDINLGWRDKITKNIGYSIGIVASTVHNEVLSLGQGNSQLFGGGLGFGGFLGTRTAIGTPIGAFYGLKTNGLFQTPEDIKNGPVVGDEKPGDLRYVDINHDGKITTDSDRIFLGSPIPNFIYGLNLGVNAYGFDISTYFNGVSGNKIWNSKKLARFGTPNFETSYLGSWTGPGTSTTTPRALNSGHNYLPSDYWIEDGSYTALRNLQIGYTLPPDILKQIHLTNLRIYVGATNLKTWAKYSGYTPEISSPVIQNLKGVGYNSGDLLSAGIDGGAYPVARTYTVGLNATF